MAENLESMIHHKVPLQKDKKIVYSGGVPLSPLYGVSSSRRVLSKQLFIKKQYRVFNFLKFTLGFPNRESEAVLGLLRYWAYYGVVYAKQAQVSEDQNVSKASFWRAVRRLRDRDLVTVVNRFIIRPHAQISNLYRLDRLLLLIARYLAEHGTAFYEKWLQPYLTMPGSQFWPSILPTDTS